MRTKYGYCIFNADDGACIIHKIRPILCRVFPFFPKEQGTCVKDVTFTGLSIDEGKEIWMAHFLEIKNQQIAQKSHVMSSKPKISVVSHEHE